MLWTRASRPPHRAEEYRQNFRTYYRTPHSKPRPRRKKRSATPGRLFIFPLYIAIAILLAIKLSGRPLITPSKPHVDKPRPVLRPVSADSMRPPQFGTHVQNRPASLDALHHALNAAEDDDESQLGNTDGGEVMRVSKSMRDGVPNVVGEFRGVKEKDQWTRTCYFSSRTGDSLCVHVPFCVRHNAIVYMSETLRCAPYSNKQGKSGTLSMGRCVELEREVENVGEIEQVEHKPKTWLSGLERDQKVLWFEGDTVFIKMGKRCTTVVHFAERIFMLHHVLQHPQRYGMGAVSNVVVAADEDVAKKIRYTKSWHHGLLAAIVYPNKLIYSHKEMRELVTSMPTVPGEMRVFVSAGEWDLARGRLVPCFRRAALAGSVRSQFFLTEDVYPGMVEQEKISQATRYRDADVFRTLLFQSLGHPAPPGVKKEIVYLHRASTRSMTASGLSTLEAKLRQVADQTRFEYRLLDVAKMTFPQQIQAVSGSGIIVGIHGTQMLNTLFLPSTSAVIEIFPYGFSNHLFEDGSGAGIHYAHHQITIGEDFADLPKFHNLQNCLKVSRECRAWYQSDYRKLDFGFADAEAVGKLVEQAVAHVAKSI